MINKLSKIRNPDNSLNLKRKIINSILILLFGILLGILAKWLDNLSINDSIKWQRVIEQIDLRNILSEMNIWIFIAINLSIFSKTPLRASLNVFLFFLGMTISYHLYTIIFSGFNPRQYMLVWYIVTIISPILAFICWYSKSEHIVSVFISSIIIAIMISISFSIGFGYIDLYRLIYLIMVIGVVITLHVNIRNTLISIIIGLILSFFIPNINIIIYNLF